MTGLYSSVCVFLLSSYVKDQIDLYDLGLKMNSEFLIPILVEKWIPSLKYLNWKQTFEASSVSKGVGK